MYLNNWQKLLLLQRHSLICPSPFLEGEFATTTGNYVTLLLYPWKC